MRFGIGLGFFALFFASQSVAVMAIPYYHMQLKIDPFWVGVVLTLPILVSAGFNPWFGKLFDQNSFLQNRARVVLISGWITAFLFGMVWMAPTQWPQHSIIVYLFCVITVFAISLTILSLACRCIVFEYIPSDDERNIQFGIIALFEKIGAIMYFWFFPISQIAFSGSRHNGMQIVGWAIAVFLIGMLTSFMARVTHRPNGIESKIKHSPISGHQQRVPIPPEVAAKVNFILFQVFVMFAILGTFVGLDYYLIVYFMFEGNLEIGSLWKGGLSTLYALIGIAFIPIVIRASKKNDGYMVIRNAYCLAMIGGPLKWLIFQPGNEYTLWIDALFGAAAWTVMATLIPSMLAKISSQAEQDSGAKMSGYINSQYDLVLKLSVVVSLFTSGVILNMVGFDANLGANQENNALTDMRLIFSVGSTAVLALLFLLTHKRIRSVNVKEKVW